MIIGSAPIHIKHSAEEINKALEKRVARYKIPTKFLFLPEVPKTAGMKVEKN